MDFPRPEILQPYKTWTVITRALFGISTSVFMADELLWQLNAVSIFIEIRDVSLRFSLPFKTDMCLRLDYVFWKSLRTTNE
jgi:hypothetical protein